MIRQRELFKNSFSHPIFDMNQKGFAFERAIVHTLCETNEWADADVSATTCATKTLT
jgi:hypothetical protein